MKPYCRKQSPWCPKVALKETNRTVSLTHTHTPSQSVKVPIKLGRILGHLVPRGKRFSFPTGPHAACLVISSCWLTSTHLSPSLHNASVCPSLTQFKIHRNVARNHLMICINQFLSSLITQSSVEAFCCSTYYDSFHTSLLMHLKV